MTNQQPLTVGSDNRPRYVLLDLLRIFAALWVVAFHWGLNSSWMTHAPEWLLGGFRAGYLGVDVFFMLSGAVIAYTAIGRTWRQFAVARFLRLAPAFFGATILTIAFLIPQGQLDLAPVNWLNLTGLHFFFGVPSFVSVAWTLFYELEFYVLIGILILISRNRLTEAGIRNGATVFLIVALFAQFSGNNELLILTIQRFGGMFALGALLGISRTREQLQRNLPALVLASSLTYFQLLARTGEMGLGDAATMAWSVGILVGVGGIILLSALRPLDIRPVRLRMAIATFAIMTYPIYLLHLEIGMGSIRLMSEAGLPVAVTAVLAFAILFFLSWFFVRVYEPWARGILRRIFGWTRRPARDPLPPDETATASRPDSGSAGSVSSPSAGRLKNVARDVVPRAAEPVVTTAHRGKKNGKKAPDA